MTDTAATQSAAPEPEPAARNKTAIFDALAALGIDRVTVEYDGSGDSGQIESIEAWSAGNEKIPLPTGRRLQLASGNADPPVVEMNLEEALNTLAYDCLGDLYCGWGNNGGAFGSFVFSVADHSITLEHNERYTEYNTKTHEL